MSFRPEFVYTRDRRYAGTPYEDIEPQVIANLIKGVLPALGKGFMVGESKAGKTFIALDWCLRIACGAQVLGRKTKQVGVVYIAAEDPHGCKLRLAAWKRKHPRGSYTPFTLIEKAPNLQDADSVQELLVELRDIAAIYDENDFRLGMVIFDTWAACIPGSEENGSGMSVPLAALDTIGADLSAFSLAIAHMGKTEGKGIRGWSGQDAASDATITVERNAEMPDMRTITLSKVKNGQDGAVFGFALERQPLGLIDEDGEEMWSCTVAYDMVVPDKVPKGRRKALSPQAEIVLASIGRLTDRETTRQAPPVGVEGIRAGTWAVRRSDVSLEAATSGLSYEGEKANTYNTRFGRAVNELQGAKRIRVFGDAVWLL